VNLVFPYVKVSNATLGENHGKIPCANKPFGFAKTKGKIEINNYKN